MKNNSTLIDLVKEEAANLKMAATELELNNLDFTTMNPEATKSCIYGQMTGSCVTDRAHELIKKCCKAVFKPEGITTNPQLNGAPDGKRSVFNYTWFSPIEAFIVQDENRKDNNRKLIDYLKGNSKTLDI